MKRHQITPSGKPSSQYTKHPNWTQSDSKPSLPRPATQGAKLKYHNKPWRQDSGPLSIQRIGDATPSSKYKVIIELRLVVTQFISLLVAAFV